MSESVASRQSIVIYILNVRALSIFVVFKFLMLSKGLVALQSRHRQINGIS